MNTHNHDPITLSPEGEARRERMLADLKVAVRARRLRRRAAQGALAALPILAIAALLAIQARTSPTPEAGDRSTRIADRSPPTTPPPAPEPIALSHVSFSQVTTNADVSRRVVGDDELLRLLREAGYDAGIARLGSRVVVTGMPAPPEPGADDRGPGAGAPPSSESDQSV